jgi:hypothetical protein
VLQPSPLKRKSHPEIAMDAKKTSGWGSYLDGRNSG